MVVVITAPLRSPLGAGFVFWGLRSGEWGGWWVVRLRSGEWSYLGLLGLALVRNAVVITAPYRSPLCAGFFLGGCGPAGWVVVRLRSGDRSYLELLGLALGRNAVVITAPLRSPLGAGFVFWGCGRASGVRSVRSLTVAAWGSELLVEFRLRSGDPSYRFRLRSGDRSYRGLASGATGSAWACAG